MKDREPAPLPGRPIVMTAYAHHHPRRGTCAALAMLAVAAAPLAAGCGRPSGGTTPSRRPPASAAAAPEPTAPSTAPATAGTPPAEGTEPHTRNVGPSEQGSTVAIRVGDQLTVTPPASPGPWLVASYPVQLLRPLGVAGPATRHAFLAIAAGQGTLTFTAADHTTFTIHLRVARALVRHPAG